MGPVKKRKLRNSTIDSVNIFNAISGLGGAVSRRNTIHGASTPPSAPRDARAELWDIPETPPPKQRKITSPRTEPLTRQLRSHNVDILPSKPNSTLEDEPPASHSEHDVADITSNSRDETHGGQHSEQYENVTGKDQSEEEEARQEEREQEEDRLEEVDYLPNRVNLLSDDSDDSPDESSEESSPSSDEGNQPTSYQEVPKSDGIEVLIHHRSGDDQTTGDAPAYDKSVSSASEIEDRGPEEAEYLPEESDGERQGAQQLEAVESIPAEAVDEPSHPERDRKSELQDLSQWLAQEIGSSPQGALWEILRASKRELRRLAIKPMPKYLEGANAEVTEMRQLYYDIIKTSTLTSATRRELRNLREAIRTEATRIFEYAAEEAPEETGEGAELLNQFEAHVVGPMITLVTFGYRAFKMLGLPAYDQFEGLLEVELWCCTQISYYRQTSYLKGTRAKSKALILPLKRIIQSLGKGDLGTSRTASSRPSFSTQGGDVSYTQDSTIFTQGTQSTDYDIPPSQRPWTSDEEDALRSGVRRFSGQSPSISVCVWSN
ncbi:hypothetical protein F1880_003574 [Penicillium rolfsii]|nr:hypothetical protein F1880_003574 [Penicillium rolfsii]